MRASQPLVSAVIPTYNYARFVGAAVESALAQTYQPIEIIVVDDGSTDDTAERLVPYRDRIRYIYQPNQGLSAARNTGIRAASGEFVTLLDSDDLWHPQRLALQVPILAGRPEVGLIASGHQISPAPQWLPIAPADPIPIRSVTTQELLVRSRFGSCGVLIRRSCFDEVGFFDTSLRSAEDRDMWLRVAARFPILLLDLPLWWYREHQGSMSTVAGRMEENEMKVLCRALDAQDAPAWLRRKVISYTLKSSAYRYASAGKKVKAIGRLIRSFALWPLPYRADERITRYERTKMLVLFILRMIRSRLAPTA